jgi:hypothetical protein
VPHEPGVAIHENALTPSRGCDCCLELGDLLAEVDCFAAEGLYAAPPHIYPQEPNGETIVAIRLGKLKGKFVLGDIPQNGDVHAGRCGWALCSGQLEPTPFIGAELFVSS